MVDMEKIILSLLLNTILLKAEKRDIMKLPKKKEKEFTAKIRQIKELEQQKKQIEEDVHGQEQDF